MQKWETNGDFIEGKCNVQIISFHEDTHTKIKTLNTFGQKHQVVHDHYSFWNLKKTGSSMEV